MIRCVICGELKRVDKMHHHDGEPTDVCIICKGTNKNKDYRFFQNSTDLNAFIDKIISTKEMTICINKNNFKRHGEKIFRKLYYMEQAGKHYIFQDINGCKTCYTKEQLRDLIKLNMRGEKKNVTK